MNCLPNTIMGSHHIFFRYQINAKLCTDIFRFAFFTRKTPIDVSSVSEIYDVLNRLIVESQNSRKRAYNCQILPFLKKKYKGELPCPLNGTMKGICCTFVKEGHTNFSIGITYITTLNTTQFSFTRLNLCELITPRKHTLKRVI